MRSPPCVRPLPLAILLAAVAAPSARAQETAPVGALVVVEVAAGAVARHVTEGTLPALRTVAPVVSGTDTLVRAGAPVWATVRRAVPPRSFGLPATLHLTLDSVRAADGRAIPLAGTIARQGESQVLPAALASLVSWGSFGLVLLGGDAAAVRCERVIARLGAPAVPAAHAAPAPAPTPAAAEPSPPPCAPSEAAIRLAYRKRTSVAVLLNYLAPGAGHLYAGDRRRGRVILSLVLPSVAIVMSEMADTGPGGFLPHNDLGAAIFGVAGSLWIGGTAFALFDAPRAVRHHNERVLTDPAFVPPGLEPLDAAPRVERGARQRLFALRPVARLALAGRAEGAPRRVPALGVSLGAR